MSTVRAGRVSILYSQRLVFKHGRRNMISSNLPEKMVRFTKDIVHTLVEMPWSILMLIVVLTFFTTWTFFAIIYYSIALINGDLEFDEFGERMVKDRDPCIIGARTFSGFFLHSVESQVSTGYGAWYPSEDCPSAITTLIIQLVFGLIIDSAIIGIVIEKLICPPKYAHKEFSKHAVICQRDDKYCLLFRVADFRQTRSMDSKIRAFLFEDAMTSEGEVLEKRQKRLKIESSGRTFMLWPQTVCHVIDENSPLYEMGPRELAAGNFEIIIIHKGESSYSGHTNQARTSFLSNEILWGYRFMNITSFDDQNENFVADIEAMDDVEKVEMPQYSAKVYDELKKLDDGSGKVVKSELRSFKCDFDKIESVM